MNAPRCMPVGVRLAMGKPAILAPGHSTVLVEFIHHEQFRSAFVVKKHAFSVHLEPVAADRTLSCNIVELRGNAEALGFVVGSRDRGDSCRLMVTVGRLVRLGPRR